MLRAAVRHPLTVWPGETTLRGDDHPRSVTGPGGQRARDEPLVVSDVALVRAVAVGGVEERDAGVERGVHDGDRPVVVAAGRGGQAHAADADGTSLTGSHGLSVSYFPP